MVVELSGLAHAVDAGCSAPGVQRALPGAADQVAPDRGPLFCSAECARRFSEAPGPYVTPDPAS